MTIRKTILAALALALFALPLIAADPSEDDVQTWRETCEAAMVKLGMGLQTELKTAMREGGPIGAIDKCNVAAVPIAETISTEEGLLVARTSLKPRNSNNTPDPWERQTLEVFEKRHAAKEKILNLEAWTIVTDDEGHRTFRYMKAIGTKPMCLKCHGRKIDTEVAERVAELYPDDQATGFKAGDIRGAFSVKLPLD